MPSNDLGSRTVGPSTTTVGTGFAVLTLLTHAANFTFVAVAGRLLDPADFSALVAMLGIVLVGLAPGMAVQALTAAGVLGRPAVVDRGLGARLGLAIGVVVLVVVAGAWFLLDLEDPTVLVVVPLAAGLLPLTAVNEGLLQGHRRFVALGTVMLVGATVKLALGTVAVVMVGTVGLATAAVAAGYGAQFACSRAAARPHGGSDATRSTRVGRDLVYAVGLTGALLVLLHLDAVLAPGLLEPEAAGRYGVGVTATRITFWLPQFAVLLWYPRMVRDQGRHALGVALGAVLGLGVAAALGAALLGPWAAPLVFGEELGRVGPHLWRFAWLGAAGLGVQVLALADLATGGRGSLLLLLATVAAVAVALPLVGPTTASGAVMVPATALTTALAIGAVRAVRATPGTPS